MAWRQSPLYLHDVVYKNSKNENVLIDKYQRSKQANLAESCEKRASNMKAYYTIPMNYRLNRHPENIKIKLYNFQERLSLRFNIILKLLSLFHICF